MTIHIIPTLKDNYAFVIEGKNGNCLVFDPGEAGPVLKFIEQKNFCAAAIFNTHHHGDHIGGNSAFDCPVIGPEKERERIPELTKGVADGDAFQCAGLYIHVIENPGHTAGHIVFYVPSLSALFTGDALFSLGCGRLFEGNANQMFDGLQKIKSLPPETNIYCGHEYTLSNARFALSVEPENIELQKRMAEVEDLRAQNLPTIPVSLEAELETNPFLRAKTAQDFASLRRLRDNF